MVASHSVRGSIALILFPCVTGVLTGVLCPVSFAQQLAGAPWVGSSCQVWDDDQGVPHIRAQTEPVGIACLGYVHARDRIGQMDYFKKIVEGRKAEFFGKEGVRSDFFFRLLGLKEKAESLYSQMTEEQKAPLKAYAWGVNLGIKEVLNQLKTHSDTNGVYEFQALGYLPESWHPEDSLKVLMLQSFDQTRRSFENQLREVQWLEKYPENAAELFSSTGLPWDVTILKEGEYPRASAAPALVPGSARSQWILPHGSSIASQAIQTFLDLPGLWSGPGAGSNNWVVSAQHSKTGHALLGNDPHLSLTHPPFWYWANVTAGDTDLMGATVPGIPFFTMGASKNLSWGVTNAFLPVAQISRVPESDLKHSSVQRPWVWVKWWKFKVPFFFKTFRRTPAGLPVLPLPAPEGQALVLNWTAYSLEPLDVMGLFQLPHAQTVAQADQILSTVRVPSWNLVFADTQGQVGYRAVGRIPRLAQLPPFGVPLESLKQVDGSEAFRHPLTPDEMPHALSPQRGWLVTANHQQWPRDSQWSSGNAQHVSFRAWRIEELLGQSSTHDLQSLQRIQCDLQAVDARFILPKLLEVVAADLSTSNSGSGEKTAFEILKHWDYQTGVQCQACPIYRRWMDRVLAEATLNPTALYRSLLKRPIADSFKQMLMKELSGALADLRGSELNWPNWGYYHRNSFPHLMGKDWFIASPIATPGDEYSVNPGTSEWNHGFYDQTAGASQRILIEMSKPPRIYSAVAGPQKDLDQRNLAAPHSEWQKWVHCEQHQRVFPLDWSQVEKKAMNLEL